MPFFGLILIGVLAAHLIDIEERGLAWLVFAMLWLLGSVDPLWVSVAIMMAALPTATNAFVLATQFNAYVEGASSSILVSTLLSAVTIPPLIYAIKAGFLP